MDGVNILNTIYEYGTNFSAGWIFMSLICMIIFDLISFLLLDTDWGWIITAVVTIISFISFLILMFTYKETSEIISVTYQATIDESVSLEEFHKYYEIIEKNGEIYTIKEIEQE